MRRLLEVTGLTATLVLASTGTPPGPAEAARRAGVTVAGLHVDGRADQPLGTDDPHPSLGWRIRQIRPCDDRVCPGDRQTAYQIRAVTGAGRLAWDSGRVDSDLQTGIRYGGPSLTSRQRITWQVRVWDAGGRPSDWSRPSTWETGLLDQSDWGKARWIEYPGRAEGQPMPMFARQFTVDQHRPVTRARLYLSGIGLHLPSVNGRPLTDEVLAPGNANYQLSSEYRTYDVTRELRRGDNTVGVRLGNGTAYVRRSVTNPATGRTAPYSWWQSQLKGSGTLAADAEAGATTSAAPSMWTPATAATTSSRAPSPRSAPTASRSRRAWKSRTSAGPPSPARATTSPPATRAPAPR
jgi:alpha-L-rhamnosidase